MYQIGKLCVTNLKDGDILIQKKRIWVQFWLKRDGHVVMVLIDPEATIDTISIKLAQWLEVKSCKIKRYY